MYDPGRHGPDPTPQTAGQRPSVDPDRAAAADDPIADIVLHSALAGGPWDAPHTARLPGTVPLSPGGWITVDEAYAGQMSLRDRLIARYRSRVIAAMPQAKPALSELYALMLSALQERPEFGVGRRSVLRPDGRTIALEPADPLATLGRLVAEDLCILEKPEDGAEHVLTAAVLCFPSHWTLAEKLGRPMKRIHAPVGRYTPDVAHRVQRLLNGLAPGRMLMRMNAMPTDLPWLFTPGLEQDSTDVLTPDLPYLRSERQVFVRLPRCGAVVFSIQTRLVARDSLTPAQSQGAAAYLALHRAAAKTAGEPGGGPGPSA